MNNSKILTLAKELSLLICLLMIASAPGIGQRGEYETIDVQHVIY
jgi:hypothetical protein